MLLNYFKLATRILIRNPFFSLINILGLSLGFSAFMVLWHHTSNELRSDRFHSDFEHKARLVFDWRTPDDFGNVKESHIGSFAPDFPEILAAQYHELEQFTRYYHQTSFHVALIGDHGSKTFISVINQNGQEATFKEENLAYADPNFFEFFSIPLINGSPQTVLSQPNGIVLSETLAEKYFGGVDVIGNQVILNDTIALKVSGVFEDLPNNTHLNFDGMMSLQRIASVFNEVKLHGVGFASYYQVNASADREALNAKINATGRNYMTHVSPQLNLDPKNFDFHLQPLDEIVFGEYRGAFESRSRPLLTVLLIVSVVILITAWINYLNLIIYANSKRFKELGVRKTSGARSSDFIIQFIAESFLMNVLAILGALTIVQVARAPLENLFHVHLAPGGGVSFSTVLAVILITIAGIIITGMYPALTVMRKSTRRILSEGHTHDFQLGHWLTVGQFSVAVVLMISVYGIYKQISYVMEKDLGIKRNEILVLDLPEIKEAYRWPDLKTFLNKVKGIAEVQDLALCSSVPGDNNRNGVGLQRNAGAAFIGMGTDGGVDERFIPFFNIKLLAGRNFINDDPANSHSIILSMNVLRRLGFENPEDAVGQTILAEAKAWSHDMRRVQIIGVIDDYKNKPLLADWMGWSNEDGVALTYHENVNAQNTPQKLAFILNHERFQEGLKKIEAAYGEIFSKTSFHWYFLNDNLNQHYRNDQIVRNQLILFSLLAVIIACLGLLGMIANKAKEKTKEIGIRKVLGASLQNIAHILLNRTIRQIVISAAIGIPCAHFLISGYLEKFSDRIVLYWWHYLVPIGILLTILLITVASTVRKAVSGNPVDSLRQE